jgi:hypothetical protein
MDFIIQILGAPSGLWSTQSMDSTGSENGAKYESCLRLAASIEKQNHEGLLPFILLLRAQVAVYN